MSGKYAGTKQIPALRTGGRGLWRHSLLSGDRAHGAGALASAAVDAGAGVDDHVLVAHGDRAHGAGALASAAGDARVSDLTSHVLHLQQMMCFGPGLIVPHFTEIAT